MRPYTRAVIVEWRAGRWFRHARFAGGSTTGGPDRRVGPKGRIETLGVVSIRRLRRLLNHRWEGAPRTQTVE